MLLGRKAERARIERLLSDARHGQGGALVIRGEPGVGKTALLGYAVDLAEAMTVVKATGVESEAELQYSGLLELVRPIQSALEGLPEHLRDALGGALGMRHTAATDRFATSAATMSLLAHVAESRPLLVVVDDAQWIDAASVDALSFAARRLPVDPVAFLFAARGDAAFGEGFDELRLEGLDVATATKLLASTAGVEVPGELAASIVEATGGNPLGLVELPMVVSVAQLEGRERLEDPLPVGAGVERSYARSIESLPEQTRDALVVVALSGRGELDLVSRALASTVGTAALAAAEDAGLVRIADERVGFRHPLVRSAIVQGASPSGRRGAHRALAEALTGRGDDERRAWHLGAAAVGPDDQASAALAAAGAAALARGGFEAAADALERSAQLTGDDEARAARLLDAAEASWSAGSSTRSAALCDDALRLSNDVALRGRSLVLQGRIELQTGTPARARDLFVQAAELVEQDDPASATGRLVLAVQACHHGGLMRDGLEVARRARALVPGDGGPANARADYMLGRALRLAGHAEEGARVLGPVLGELLALPDAELADLTMASTAAAALERDEQSRELARAATRRAREAGPMLLAQTLTLLAETCVRQGEWERAIAAATEGLALVRDLGQPNVAAYFLQSIVRVEAARGHEDACRRAASEALPLIELSGIAIPDLLVRGALGLLDLGVERMDDAVLVLEEASRRAVSIGIFGRDLLFEIDLVEALVRLGRVDRAQAVLDAWRARGGYEGSRLAGALEARCAGLLADDHAFAAWFEQALELHEGSVNPFGEARSRLCYGERLRRAGRRVDARPQLRAALDVFERLEATAWIKRTRRELRATGEKVGRRAAASGDELTPQELQVALQVAEGKTNKDVGAALFLSPKTVEFHLARVYRKLDIASRAELIRRFASETVLEPAV